MKENTKMKGILASVIFLSAGVLGIALIEIIRLKKELRAVPPPIHTIIGDIAKDKIITQAEAEAAGLEILKQLWGDVPDAKVISCEQEHSGSWTVSIQNPSGSGCQLTIAEFGFLEKAVVLMGM